MWIQRQEKNRFVQYDGAVFFCLFVAHYNIRSDVIMCIYLCLSPASRMVLCGKEEKNGRVVSCSLLTDLIHDDRDRLHFGDGLHDIVFRDARDDIVGAFVVR